MQNMNILRTSNHWEPESCMVQWTRWHMFGLGAQLCDLLGHDSSVSFHVAKPQGIKQIT